jgi:alcohol dehydrogenase
VSIETEAIVLRGSGDPRSGEDPPFELLSLEPVTLDEPGPHEVLVAVDTAAICHSDLSVLSGQRPRPTPMVLGHEASAVVATVGAGVERWRPGQHVLMTFVPSCGHCRPCVEGRPALCEPGNAANAAGQLLSGHRPFRDRDGETLHQHLGLSAFSRHTVVAENSLLPLPDEMPLDLAALLGCGVLTGVGAAVNTAAVRPGMEVAVFGLGGVGLSAVIGAGLAGAATVLGIDVDEGKFELARRLGADACMTAGPDAVAWVRANSEGGVDAAIDTTGVAAVLPDAYAATRRGGVAVVVGLADPAAEVAIAPADLVASERVIRGSYMGSTVPARDVEWLTRMHRRGMLPLGALVGARLELADVPAGFAALHRGIGGRQLIAIGGSR